MNFSSEITTSGAFAKTILATHWKTSYGKRLRHGYAEIQGRKGQIFANRSEIMGKQFAQHVPVGETIYKTKRIADALVINKDLFPDDLIIECKWQQTPGSVDENTRFGVEYRSGQHTDHCFDR